MCYKIRRKFSTPNLDRQDGRNRRLPSAGARTTTVFFSYKKPLRKIRTSARCFCWAGLGGGIVLKLCKAMRRNETATLPGRYGKAMTRRDKRRCDGVFFLHSICANDLRQNAAGFLSIGQRALEQKRRGLPKAASLPAKKMMGKSLLHGCAVAQKGYGFGICKDLGRKKTLWLRRGLGGRFSINKPAQVSALRFANR